MLFRHRSSSTARCSSGATIIDSDHWGSQALAFNWIRRAGRLHAEAPDRRLFWFLIVKGHRTYRYLPAFAVAFHPDWRGPDRSDLKRIADHLASGKFDELRANAGLSGQSKTTAELIAIGGIQPLMKRLLAAGLPVAEYATRLVKKAVVGVGNAEKTQVHAMVSRLLPGVKIDGPDAADALAPLQAAVRLSPTSAGAHNYLGGALMSLGRIPEAIDHLRTTGSSHNRAFLVETMGRDCGYIAMMAGLAGGAEVISTPENEVPSAEIANWPSVRTCVISASESRSATRMTGTTSPFGAATAMPTCAPGCRWISSPVNVAFSARC